MLTARQIELIKATVPVLKEHGVALTTHFYKRMLNGNPELKNVFNQAHQAQDNNRRLWQEPYWPMRKTLRTPWFCSVPSSTLPSNMPRLIFVPNNMTSSAVTFSHPLRKCSEMRLPMN